MRTPTELASRLRWQDLAWVAAALLLTAARLWLGTHTALILRGSWGHDDGLMIRQALSIASGEWLGEFGYLTLIKSCVYPLWVAAVSALGLSYPLALYLLWAGACALAVVALRPAVRGRGALLAIYAALLFSPAMLSYNTVQYVYRNAIVPAASLFVVGSYVGAFLRRGDGRRLALWLVLAGLSLAFFYFICENSIWLGLFAAGASVVTGVYLWVEHADRRLLALLLVPVALTGAARGALAWANWQAYGTTALNVRTETSFADVVADLTLIARDEDETDEDYWVTASMMARALEASPTLASIADELVDSYEYWGWPEGQIPGDFTQWVLLRAMDQAGLCESAATMEEFCAAVAAELEAAFEDGTLERSDEAVVRLSSGTRGIGLDDVGELLEGLAESLWASVTYSEARSSLDEYSDFTNYEAACELLDATYVTSTGTIQGWCFAWDDDAELTLVLLDEDLEPVCEVERTASDDLLEGWPEAAGAACARFYVSLADLGYEGQTTFYLAVYLDGELWDVVEPTLGTTDDGTVIWGFDYLPAAYGDSSLDVAEAVCDASNALIALWQATSVPVLVLAAAGYAVLTARAFAGRAASTRERALPLWIVVTGALACALVLVLGNSWYLSYYHGEEFLWWVSNYCMGGVVVYQLVAGLCVAELADLVASLVRARHA